jgi:formate hydrogenlyase transcriptional activator
MAEATGTARPALEDRIEFDAVVTRISAQFVSVDARLIDSAIGEALQRLGELLGVDRAALTQLTGIDHSLTFTHYWSREGEPAPYLTVDAEQMFPFGLSRILRGEVHSFSTLAELPADARDLDILTSRSTKSAVTFPLVVAGQVIGSLAFGTTREERQWDPELVRRLRLVADLFASAIARKRVDAELRQAVDDRVAFEALVADLASQFVNLDSDKVGGTIEDAQRHLVEALDLDRSALFEFDSAGNLVLTHYWSRAGIPALAFERGAIVPLFPWMVQKVRMGEVVRLSSVDDVPPDVPDRQHLSLIGTKANVSVPLSVSGRVIGVLTFATVHDVRAWPPDIVNRLGLIAQVFGSALARKRAAEDLKQTLEENVRLRTRLTRENVYLQREVKARQGSTQIVGQGGAVRRMLEQVDQVAPTGTTILLLGETGTGKELIATAIHERSPRRARMMVRVNCGAIPTALIESELFGREKGAYTGALTRQIGRFEVADGSTIFLDEIGELPPDVQVKLLRVIQEKEIERLGSSRPIPVDVRVIAATHRDIERMVTEGTFREDLYYRLNVFPIKIPPLRERPEDIPTLVWAFVDELSKTLGKRFESISNADMLALQQYPWPGNIRELRNAVERAVIVSTGPRLVIEPPLVRTIRSRSLRLEDVEREHILSVLQQTGWRVRGHAGAAELLGLKPSTLEGRMAKLGVRRPSA